jgi:hypothetical protein
MPSRVTVRTSEAVRPATATWRATVDGAPTSYVSVLATDVMAAIVG